MKNHLTKIFLVFLLLFCSAHSQAQSSAQIMDAKIDWIEINNQYSGQLSVFLTDTISIAGLTLKIGTIPDDSDLYQSSYTIGTGGNFTGTLAGNVLQAGIGTFSSHENYYAKISVLLSNGQKREIAIHSSN